MKYDFTKKEVIEGALNKIKVDVFENPLYQKTLILFEIWETQKKLGFLFDQYEEISIRVESNESSSIVSEKLSYKEQYIEFLMKHDLIFIEEVEDSLVLLNLLFYWILADVRKDKGLLDNF